MRPEWNLSHRHLHTDKLSEWKWIFVRFDQQIKRMRKPVSGIHCAREWNNCLDSLQSWVAFEADSRRIRIFPAARMFVASVFKSSTIRSSWDRKSCLNGWRGDGFLFCFSLGLWLITHGSIQCIVDDADLWERWRCQNIVALFFRMRWRVLYFW